MIFLRTKVVAPSLVLVSAALLPVQAWTMDELSDGQLSAATGQSGVSVVVTLPVAVDQVAVFDGNGFAGQTGAGAFVAGKNANGATMGTIAAKTPTLGNGISVTANKSIGIALDATGGGNSTVSSGLAPMLNVGISLPTSMTVVTGDLGIAAAAGSAGAYQVQTGGSGVVQVMGSSSVTFTLTGSPLINLQLGNPNQGAMIKLASLNIASIVYTTPLSLVSPNGGVSASQLTMTPNVTNLNLSGVTIDIATLANLQAAFPSVSAGITSGGLLLQQSTATLSGIGFSLNNITAGTTGVASSTVVSPGSTFASTMTNAPMGSIGSAGVGVTGLKIGISGM